jgi:DNA-binding MarR family transcriptional regulator
MTGIIQSTGASHTKTRNGSIKNPPTGPQPEDYPIWDKPIQTLDQSEAVIECSGYGSISDAAMYQWEILSTKDSKSQYNKDKEKKILLSNDESIKKNGRDVEREILSKLDRILTSKSTIQAYKHFLDVGCSFANELIDKCNIAEPTAHRAIKKLQKHNLIQPISPVKTRRRGPCPIIYQVRDASKQEIDKALNRVMRYQVKYYGFIEQVYQLTLSQVVDQEIQYRKIIQVAKQHGCYGYHFLDIADEIARKLAYDGYKVWRN